MSTPCARPSTTAFYGRTSTWRGSEPTPLSPLGTPARPHGAGDKDLTGHATVSLRVLSPAAFLDLLKRDVRGANIG
jgi:hypothetical protein